MTMLARAHWGARRPPLPPSNSQDLDDDLTLTEGGDGDDDSLPRSPVPVRPDRRIVRTQACDIESLDDFEPRIPRVELRRPSTGSGRSSGGGASKRDLLKGKDKAPKKKKGALDPGSPNYDTHPRVFREESFTLHKDYLSINSNYDVSQARRSSYGCEYHRKEPFYSWDDPTLHRASITSLPSTPDAGLLISPRKRLMMIN
ncbi:hypothetical protein C7M84_023122 [Penaeus vannamei]|uniref:Uncharacterized protein n=1 Tax=Penaeus vannamei TaxID=6689 RepID=A0A423U4S7_PENVA|nr:hypothetical protein C7M84_023122 [Penaeus vannamei]